MHTKYKKLIQEHVRWMNRISNNKRTKNAFVPVEYDELELWGYKNCKGVETIRLTNNKMIYQYVIENNEISSFSVVNFDDEQLLGDII